MAWVGARAFDRLGIAAFQPLLAPLLVDSHDLQDAVFHAGIPQRMLPAVDTAEIMAGQRALSDHEQEMPDTLREVLVGPLTAREIGWTHP